MLLPGQMGWRMTDGRSVPVVHVLKCVLWILHVVALLAVVTFQMELSVHVTVCQDLISPTLLL